MLLASLIAASCGVQVEAGSSQPKSDGINRPIKIQTQMESDVIPLHATATTRRLPAHATFAIR